jgi:hypothetical protein
VSSQFFSTVHGKKLKLFQFSGIRHLARSRGVVKPCGRQFWWSGAIPIGGLTTAKRIELRLGTRPGAVQRVSESNPRQFALSGKSSEKNPEKIGKKGAETGEEWRFFQGLKRHFAGLGAGGPGPQANKLPDSTSNDSGRLKPPVARRIGNKRHFAGP